MRSALLAFLVGLSLVNAPATTHAQSASKPAVLGQYAQALKASSIFSRPSTSSRAYYRVKAYEYLIARRVSQRGWVGVVMENGHIGYIQASRVALLPYNVTTNSVAQPASTSRSGGNSAKASVARYGLQYTGTPYKWGGNDLNRGIDCSGFVQQLFGKIGIDLPRTAAQQALVGKSITRVEDLLPGDRLYFWDRRRGKIGHTGLYLGNGYFVHSSSNNRGVATDDLRNPKWRKILVAARR